MTYNYNSTDLVKNIELTERSKFLLKESQTFCMYPWVHLHAWPTGQAYPCCHADWKAPQIGNCREDTLETIWNDEPMRKLRLDMLNERKNASCVRCYEQEQSGFFSGRRSANKHNGHLIQRALDTHSDGTVDEFKLSYWDIRFSNLCNLKCRTCGPSFSSLWHSDQTKIAGEEWGKNNSVLNYAGRHKTDIWEQLIPHLDYAEKIYFAGGEPLIMDEHYRILDELDRRGRYDVVLIYNTNFTETQLKDRSVFEYWKKFNSVAVGASLDAMGPRAEYIRKGTEWDRIVRNREEMLKICPTVDFYISPTLSILNAWHVPDFHRDWVNRGYIRPQDLNVNILQDGEHFRIDIAPLAYKKQIEEKYQEHLAWLQPQDYLKRATLGFKSAINFMNATDNSHLIPQFLFKTAKMDKIRNENIFEAIPELAALK